jgi:hypothetical protein
MNKINEILDSQAKEDIILNKSLGKEGKIKLIISCIGLAICICLGIFEIVTSEVRGVIFYSFLSSMFLYEVFISNRPMSLRSRVITAIFLGIGLCQLFHSIEKLKMSY